MRTTIEVKDREEARLLRRGLEDPETRAVVLLIGALKPLPTKRMQRLTLELAQEHLRAADSETDNQEA